MFTPSLAGTGPKLKQKIGVCQNKHRLRYRVLRVIQKYVTDIHRRKLVKNWRGSRAEALEWRSNGVWGYPLSSGGEVWGAVVLFFEMLNFYAFWTLEHGDGTVTVTMMFMAN